MDSSVNMDLLALYQTVASLIEKMPTQRDGILAAMRTCEPAALSSGVTFGQAAALDEEYLGQSGGYWAKAFDVEQTGQVVARVDQEGSLSEVNLFQVEWHGLMTCQLKSLGSVVITTEAGSPIKMELIPNDS